MNQESGNGNRALIVWPDDADLGIVKRHVLALKLPFKVTPFKAEQKDGRVLVLADGFPHIRDHIYPKSDATVPKAIRWCLGIEDLERGPKLLKDNLDAALGAPTKEIIEGVHFE